MGLISRLFAPITKARKFYRDMVHGSPEEIAQQRALKQSSDAFESKLKEMESIMEQTQSGALRTFARSMRSMGEIEKEMKFQDAKTRELMKLMESEEVDPVKLFGLMQQMKLEPTENGFVDHGSAHLKSKLTEISDTKNIIDLQEMAKAMAELSEAQAKTDSLMESMAKTAPKPKYATKEELQDVAVEQAQRQGMDAATAAKLVRQVTERGSKKL